MKEEREVFFLFCINSFLAQPAIEKVKVKKSQRPKVLAEIQGFQGFAAVCISHTYSSYVTYTHYLLRLEKSGIRKAS